MNLLVAVTLSFHQKPREARAFMRPNITSTSSAVEQVDEKFATSSPVNNGNASARRLSDTDVRAIFEALHQSKPAPPNLPFRIVRVGPNGLKLSPPSYEFEGMCLSRGGFIECLC